MLHGGTRRRGAEYRRPVSPLHLRWRGTEGEAAIRLREREVVVMLRGVATATSELLAQSKRLETLAANLADADTPGYRADRLDEQTFSSILLDRIDQGSTQVGPIELGPVMSR